MKLLTAAQMRAVDTKVIKEIGIPSMVLMENAGRQVAETAVSYLRRRGHRKVSIVVGKGNNGGDGFVAARYLHNLGLRARVFMTSSYKELSQDALANYHICCQLGIDIQEIDEAYLPKLRFALSLTDLIIDGLLGTGLKGPPKDLVGDVIELINDIERPVLAVDVPSGLDADTGKVFSPCIKADLTVTLAAPKVGLFVYPGAEQTGRVHVANICIPQELLNSAGNGNLITAKNLSKLLPSRPEAGHKGTFGRVLILAGARGMTGAAALSSQGALLAGSGLVFVGVPQSLNDIMETKTTEAMTIALAETAERCLSVEALPKIEEYLPRMDALVIGPGLGQHPSTGELVRTLLEQVNCPIVLDADGLNVAAQTGILESRTSESPPLVLTPHPGEMARLLGCSVEAVQQERIKSAVTAAQKFLATVVLKGAGTVVAASNGGFWVNTTGNMGMATGGSGDVLTGIIGGRLAGGMAPVDAAVFSVYAHGLAGDLAYEQLGALSLLAGDVLKKMPQALQLIEREEVTERWIYLE
ncbi:MAG: NAD(P)H-hydrate dehydratase [Firmicutes bacterium]|nr:NAD(P)H-hydrate dehydratase [Bacillota bacterium]